MQRFHYTAKLCDDLRQPGRPVARPERTHNAGGGHPAELERSWSTSCLQVGLQRCVVSEVLDVEEPARVFVVVRSVNHRFDTIILLDAIHFFRDEFASPGRRRKNHVPQSLGLIKGVPSFEALPLSQDTKPLLIPVLV
jgi:hypothetical protein